MELRDKKMFVMSEEERQVIRKVIDIFDGAMDVNTYHDFQLWQADQIKKDIIKSISTLTAIYLFSRKTEEKGKYLCILEELEEDLCEDACTEDEENCLDDCLYPYEDDEPAAADEVLGYEE